MELERRWYGTPMRNLLILAAAVLGLSIGFVGCESAPWSCGGVDLSDPSGGALCHCVATGQLCDHSGFGSCLACPIETP